MQNTQTIPGDGKTLRERVGSAVNASDLRGHTLTTLNAFAVGSTPLGEALWRVKYANDRTMDTRRRAILLLLHEVRPGKGRAPSDLMQVVVEQAFAEWLESACPDCGGRRFTGSEYGHARASREQCVECHGRGRFSGSMSMFATLQEYKLNQVSCQRCGGKGWLPTTKVDASKTTVCRTCNGRGRVKRSTGARAITCGLTTAEFERYWAKIYDRALNLLRREDRATSRTVSNAMRSLEGAPGLVV